MAADRALRARYDEVVRRCLGRRLAAQLGALRLPAALEHLRHPVDDDVEEASDAEPDQRGADEHEDLFRHRLQRWRRAVPREAGEWTLRARAARDTVKSRPPA